MNNVKGSKENEDYKIDFDRIAELIEKYKSEKTQGKIKGYTEEQTKVVFITPFFKALGWNAENRQNRNDSVSYEENIAGKRSDYGFSINGITKFYLEAKSLKEEDILFNTGYDKQAVNYAWLKSCSWAVLTNFETLAVYNADSGKAEWAFTLKSEEYLDENGKDKLKLLSKRGFEEGLLDAWALVNGKKPMKRPVDKQLLQDMIHFRETLSKDIKKNNPHVSEDDIDETVQRILDRLVFIRNAEDRGYEPKELKSNYNQWSQKEKGHLIKKVRELYQHYRDVYNSGLFGKESKTIHISDQVDISNETLSEVIQGLYSPEGAVYSYNFAVLDTDVLGKIYEQYLGNLLKQTPKRAKLEESKTHRKEQGIYYTPSYIVDYIVKNAVGEFIKTHTPEEIRKVRILDPACGSGSFLIRAYKELEEYWSKYYEKNKEISESARTVRQTKFNPDMEGNEIEFYSTKTEILKNNIFGVDLDPKAVEIAQLNLLLQISERKHRLPILQNNIKVGNSLIDDPSISDRAFKWEEEFPEIMKEGGFDIVIGNPPYGAELSKKESEFVLNKYPANRNNSDTAITFINKAYLLLRDKGHFGLIVPKPLIYSQKWINARNFVIPDLLNLADVSKAFEEVLLEQVIIILKKNSNAGKYMIDFLLNNKQSIEVDKRILKTFDILINNLSKEELILGLNINKSGKFLSEVAEIERGVFIQKYLKKSGEVPVLRGKNIGRYEIKEFTDFIDYQDINKLHLDQDYLKKPKVVIQNIVAHVLRPKDHIVIMSAFDQSGLITLDNVGNIITKGSISPYFIIGLLNSKLINWYAYRFIYAKAIRTMRFDKYHLSKIPLPSNEYTTKPEYNKIIEIVQELTRIKIKLKELTYKSTDSYLELERKVENLELDLNNLIYRIYGLNKNQIAIIEESFNE